jgi:hypothetical protein
MEHSSPSQLLPLAPSPPIPRRVCQPRKREPLHRGPWRAHRDHYLFFYETKTQREMTNNGKASASGRATPGDTFEPRTTEEGVVIAPRVGHGELPPLVITGPRGGRGGVSEGKGVEGREQGMTGNEGDGKTATEDNGEWSVGAGEKAPPEGRRRRARIGKPARQTRNQDHCQAN